MRGMRGVEGERRSKRLYIKYTRGFFSCVLLIMPKGLDSSRHVKIFRNNTTFFKNMFQQNLLSSSV